MKKKLLKSLALFLVLNFTLSTFAAVKPTADDGKWYYVKSQRFDTGGPWWTLGEDNFVVPGALTKSDVQKFTIVKVGETDKVTIKSHSGLLFTAKANNAEGGNFDELGPATGWDVIDNMVDGVVGKAFPGENVGIHQGKDGTWNWRVATGWYDLSDNCTFFFYEAREDIELQIAIDDAIVMLNKVSVGEGIGLTPEEAVEAFEAAIKTAKETLESTDLEEIEGALAELSIATKTFVNAKVPAVTSSTEENPVWYLIKNTNRGGKGATLYTTTFGAQIKNTTVANSVAADGSSTGAAAPTLNHLFRFEKQASGKYKVVNAAMPSGEVLQGASGGNSSEAIKYGETDTPKWDIQLIGVNAELEVTEIKFVSDNGTVWHADGSNNLVSWNGGTGSASAWYVEEYTGSVSDLFQSQYDALEAQYNEIVDGSGNPIAPYLLGTEPGTYDADKFDAMKDKYNAMVEEKDNNGITSSGLIQNFADLGTAIAAFKASKVSPVAYGGTIETGEKYTLQLVQDGAEQDGYYLANPRTDANNGADGNRPYATFSSGVDEDTTVWTFVASSTPGKYIITSTRREGANEYIDEEGRVRDASSYEDSNWTTKTLMQNTLTYVDGTTLLIVKIDKNGNYLTVGNAADATMGRNGSSWATFRVSPYIPTSVDSNAISTVNVNVVNRMIMVTGTEELVDVFSITGAKVDIAKQLNPGIYIVKAGGFAQKVIVK